MKAHKAIGYALILVGFVFGVEGSIFLYSSTLALTGINELLVQASVFESAAELAGATAFFQQLQLGVTIFMAYSFLKVICGIVCMGLGYLVLTGEEIGLGTHKLKSSR